MKVLCTGVINETNDVQLVLQAIYEMLRLEDVDLRRLSFHRVYRIGKPYFNLPNFSCQARIPPTRFFVFSKPIISRNMAAWPLRLPLRQ